MDRARYIILRIITFPFSVLPYTVIHKIGNALGLISFYLLKSFRKRALSNIALASDLKLDSKKIKSIAIGSFQNLMITMTLGPVLFWIISKSFSNSVM